MALRKTASRAVKPDSLSDKNDLGKPWRFVDEDTGLTVTRSCVWSPPGCHPVGCGLKLYTDENGRLVKVEGDENHPVTQGRLCVRCIALKDYEYSTARILHPMKRDRDKRGDADAWEETTWEEALDLIEDRYKDITGRFGKECFVNFGGTGREGGVANMTFTSMVWQSPNACYTQSGYACYFPRLAAGSLSAGVVYPEIDYAGCLPARYDDPDYHVPEAIVVWGKMPLASNPDGMFGHAVIDLMKRGSKLIMIDSRINWLTTRAAYHLQIRPGTDTAVGMAMLDVIIKEDLYDHEFVDLWCYGFEQLAERVAEMPAEKAAEICGIAAEGIVGAARMYAQAEAASIQWGLATDQKTNGMQQAHCIISLMAITGNIDRPGGQIISGGAVALDADTEEDDEYMPYMALDDKELRDKMIGLKEYPAYCGMSQNSHADLTLHCPETDEPYPLRMGAFAGNNLLACTSAEPKRWERAINRSLEFVIGFDCFMTPSIQAVCDVVLPLATVVERDSTVAAAYGSAPLYFGVQNKAVDEGDCRGDLEPLFLLGKRLNPQRFEEFDTYYDLLQFLRFGKSRSFEALRDQVVLQSKNEYYKYKSGKLRPDGKPGFNTPTGRVELYNNAYQQFGDDPLPYYEEPDYGPISTPELMDEYPFILTTGARTYAFFHSEHRQIPRLRELNPDPIVEINPDDARKLGIAEGQWCRIWNMFGEARYKAHLTVSVKLGVIHAQHGWWFPEKKKKRQCPQPLRNVSFEHQQSHPQRAQRQARLRGSFQVPDLQHRGHERKPRYGHEDNSGKIRKAEVAMSANGLLIDYEFCTGCQSCEISCKEEHDYPVGKWGIRVLDEGPWEIEEGLYNWNKLPVPTDLCDLCADRTGAGSEPLCVHHCLANVMMYGKVEDLAKRMDGNRRQVLFVPVFKPYEKLK